MNIRAAVHSATTGAAHPPGGAPAPRCPCCGALVDGETRLERVIRECRLSPTERDILLTIARRPQLRLERLADAIYAHRADGGPLYAASVVAVTICRMRPKVSAFGLSIVCGKGKRDGYQLRWGDE